MHDYSARYLGQDVPAVLEPAISRFRAADPSQTPKISAHCSAGVLPDPGPGGASAAAKDMLL